jgi:hypothetical protein
MRLILGGTQFLGRTLAKLALSDGWQVTTFAFRTAASRLPGGTARLLAAAAASTEFEWLVKDSRDEAFNEAGLDVGTPVLRIGGTALFGPGITPAPRGEAAGRLWDGRSWSPGRTASSSSCGAAPQAVLRVSAHHSPADAGPGRDPAPLAAGCVQQGPVSRSGTTR